MLILWLGTLLLVRYVAKEVFFRFSYHRGVWHSLLALVFCAFVTAWVFYRCSGATRAWRGWPPASWASAFSRTSSSTRSTRST